MISAVAFLGNHGKKYQQNRHNQFYINELIQQQQFDKTD
jgi:peptidyl-tRNA hydrolase